MKKLYLAIALTIMPFSIMSCGGTDDNESVNNEIEKPEQPKSDPDQLIVDLQMPGTLSSNIPNQKITKLKIKGDINGSDIKFIRGIISELSELDLSDANIVEGGDAYYKISYRTNNNVIGEYMFADLIGNYKIILPKSATLIDKYAFENSVGLIEVMMYDNIKSISEYCFSGCSKLTKVGFSNSLRSLGESAFENCASIDNIVLPSNISTIGRECFYECGKLSKIILSEKLGTIGKRAFYGCKGLRKIEIPSNVYSIDTYAFEGCSSLSDVLINGRIKTLSAGVFKGTNLKSFTTPESLEEIQSQAFLDCYELEKINIGKNVKKIGTGCATYCTKFSEFIVSSDNNYYCSIAGVLFNKDKTQLISYPHGKPDAEYTVPSSVTSIGGRSFESTEYLTSIILPSSLERIEANAFLSYPTSNKKLVEFHAKSKMAPLVVYNGFGQYGLPHRNNERFETAYVPKGCLKEYTSMWQNFFNHICEE